MEGIEIRNYHLASTCLMLVLLVNFIFLGSSVGVPVERPNIQGRLATDYIDHGAITITNDSGFVDHGFTGSGTPEDPYTLSNVNITSSDTAISIQGTKAHFVIRDSWISSGSHGIILSSTSNGTISNCTITTGSNGISVSDARDVWVLESEIRGGKVGIFGRNITGVEINQVGLHHNNDGIFVSNGTANDIVHSTMYSNRHSGIWFYYDTTNNTISDCTIGWNGPLENGVITSELNVIDYGFANKWDSVQWSDYSGVGDYDVGLESIVVNPMPLQDISAPTVSGIDDIHMEADDPLRNIHWNVTDEYLSFYQVWIDGQFVSYGDWYEHTLQIKMREMSFGVHNYTAVFFDAAGNRASDEVQVLVLVNLFEGEGTEYVLYASLVSIIGVLGVLVFIKRFL